MSLHDTILADLTAAMKERDTDRVAVLRLIKSALLNTAKETGAEKLDDATVIATLQREAKKRRESITAFEAGDRMDLADQEKKELAIIEGYLPEQLSEDEIRAAVQAVIGEMGSDNFGAVMGAVMKKLQGRADGNQVKSVVEKLLHK
ncbi:MAG: GatB/YqeY domain-containing protein [Candidatus Kerfeldbacteria bacterium]